MNDLVAKAARFAAVAHNGQFRRYPDVFGITEPFICHPARVAGMVAHYHVLFKEDNFPGVMAAAWLHDVVEDTGREIDPEEFHPYVAELVRQLTKPSVTDDYSSLPRSQRFAMDVEHYEGVGRSAKIIKMCDRIDNVRSLHQAPVEYSLRYLRESDELLDALRDADYTVGNALEYTIAKGREFFSSYIPLPNNS